MCRQSDLPPVMPPLALIYRETTGREPLFIAGISLYAVIYGVLIQIVMASRILYGMAKQGWAPRFLSQVSRTSRTPLASTLLVTGLVMLFAFWLPMVTLVKITSLMVLTIFSLVNLALWRIKSRCPQAAEVRSYPQAVPATGFIASTLFLAYSLWMWALC